jgi:hypothetical protein
MARINIPVVEASSNLTETIDKLKASGRSAVAVRSGKELRIIPAWQLIQSRASGNEIVADIRAGIVYRSEKAHRFAEEKEAIEIPAHFRTLAIGMPTVRPGLRVETIGPKSVTLVGTAAVLEIANGVPRCVCRNPLRKPPHSYWPAEAQALKMICVDDYEIVCP